MANEEMDVGTQTIGGIGGGGLVIPVSIALFGFSTREAIAISNATIFGGAMVRFLFFSIWEKHPTNKQKTVINYTVANVMMPIVLVGSYVGAILNIVFPEAVLGIVLTVLLIFLTYNTTKKGIAMYKKEE